MLKRCENEFIRLIDLKNYAEVCESTARKYIGVLKIPTEKRDGYFCMNKKYLPLFQDFVKKKSNEIKKFRHKEKNVIINAEPEESRRKRFFSCFPLATEQDWKNFNTESWFPNINPFSSLEEDDE